MEEHHLNTDVAHWKHCTCCGLKIRSLEDHRSLLYFMGMSMARRRGFKCANCGHVNCCQCSAISHHCACNSNAWVAMPYVTLPISFNTNDLGLRQQA